MMTMKTTSSVGCIYNIIVPYYNKELRKTCLKARPCLIIGEPIGDKEYTILPVSTMLQEKYLDLRYDIHIVIEEYPKLGLKKNSYIRCGKQTQAYEAGIDFRKCLGNLKCDYPEIFELVLTKTLKANRERFKAYS